MKRVMFAFALASLFAVLGCSNPAPAPTPTCQDHTATNFGGPLPCTYPAPPPACQTNDTGVIAVTVANQVGLARDIHIDDVNYGVQAFGTTVDHTVNANLSHVVQWFSTLTGLIDTADNDAIVAQCGTLGISDSPSSELGK